MMVDHDYRISLWLDHHPFVRAYFIGYSVRYEPRADEKPSQLCVGDWDGYCAFCVDHNDDLAQYPIDHLDRPIDRTKLLDYYRYEECTEEEFWHAMDLNYERCIRQLFDKRLVLDFYRNDWILFRTIPYDTVRKIARLAGLDAEKVIEIRDSNVRKWPV